MIRLSLISLNKIGNLKSLDINDMDQVGKEST